MDLGLKGKKVLITASSGGIGKETARLFLEEGAKVLLNGRGLEKLADALKSFSDQYGAENVMSVCGDACDQKTVEDIAETVEHQLEGLDILIPCVGTGKGISSDRLDPTEWHYMMDKNVHGTIALIHACIPFLRKSSMPAIVLISSVVACSRA